jgi:signal transduction histidine kinase
MPASPESVRLFNALPTPHLLLSPAFVIEAVSDAYLRATLTQRAHLVGQYMFDAFPENPHTPEANGTRNVLASLRQVLATKQPQRISQQHYDVPDPALPGQFVERYWQALNSPVLDAAGNVVQIIHTAVDITAEVQARAHLQESHTAEQAARAEVALQRQRFREVLTQMPAFIAVYQGPDHIYQFVNPAYQSLFPHRSFLGRPFREGTPESVELGVVALFDQVYQTGEPVYLREMEGWFDFHGNGQLVQVFLSISLHPLRNVQGDIDGVLDFTYDVSEQVRARRQVEQLNQELENRVQARTQELREANAHLRRTNADLDTFVYTASHDLKAPITNIEGLLLALHEVLPAEVQQTELVAELLRLLQDTVGRFRFTITQLTDLVRLQQSQTGPTEPVALRSLLEAVCQDLAAEIRVAGATVHVQVPTELRVTFIPANLRSIVYNLLSNAVKYRAPERPAQVWVRAEQQAGAVVLAVQDNGLGLDQTQQGRLFQLFQRLHTHVEGTGVGLYMIKRLIENGGATIAVSSEPHVGSTFTVTFRA